MRDPKLVARVSGYSVAQEYALDWTNHTASFLQEVVTESRSLSLPTTNAKREGDTIVLLGDPPVRGERFTLTDDWRTTDSPEAQAHRTAFEKGHEQ